MLTRENLPDYYGLLLGMALRRCPERADAEDLAQQTALSALAALKRGETVENPEAYLRTLLVRRHNDMLRRKYRGRVDYYGEVPPDDAVSGERTEDALLRSEEAEEVRRGLSRLAYIHREVMVRHYMNGESAAHIADALGIPVGTVLTRLKSGRELMREEIKMEKYTEASYRPKKMQLGIWGSSGCSGEPFSLVSSPLAANILITAYEKPLPAKRIADAMGVPCAYVEPELERLVRGELAGRTPGGLFYTRMVIYPAETEYGDIPAQEKLADETVGNIWEIFCDETDSLREGEEYAALSGKQKVTLLVDCLRDVAVRCAISAGREFAPMDDKILPERPGGGRWLATGKTYEDGEKPGGVYSKSGPVQYGWSDDPDRPKIRVSDAQTCFGDAHWAYGGLKYSLGLNAMAELYYSLIPPYTRPSDSRLAELIPGLEKLHIVTRDGDGHAALDVPYLTFGALGLWRKGCERAAKRVYETLRQPLRELTASTVRNIPKTVDCRECFLHDGALGAFAVACCRAAVGKELVGSPDCIGALPLIVIGYSK